MQLQLAIYPWPSYWPHTHTYISFSGSNIVGKMCWIIDFKCVSHSRAHVLHHWYQSADAYDWDHQVSLSRMLFYLYRANKMLIFKTSLFAIMQITTHTHTQQTRSHTSSAQLNVNAVRLCAFALFYWVDVWYTCCLIGRQRIRVIPGSVTSSYMINHNSNAQFNCNWSKCIYKSCSTRQATLTFVPSAHIYIAWTTTTTSSERGFNLSRIDECAASTT